MCIYLSTTFLTSIYLSIYLSIDLSYTHYGNMSERRREETSIHAITETHTYVQTYEHIHTNIYIHTYKHTYIHTYIRPPSSLSYLEHSLCGPPVTLVQNRSIVVSYFAWLSGVLYAVERVFVVSCCDSAVEHRHRRALGCFVDSFYVFQPFGKEGPFFFLFFYALCWCQ